MNKTICVFCGSSPGQSDLYQGAAKELGAWIGQNQKALVYGGGNLGVMGTVAQACVEVGGETHGIIPEKLNGWVTHIDGVKTQVVKDMHARKALMCEMSDVFVALPGGIGTWEEIFEQLAWVQLGYHDKPCYLLNINGYYDKLLEFMSISIDEGFSKNATLDKLVVLSSVEEFVQKMELA